ncbi:hypothetical protein [Nitrospirillum viridazoti]|uniref:Phage tail assembly protein n=1 Tax=Nitrospirillum viridazoti CBAmc TaxID=1441467 RepID=A0A248JRP7_9PROT|nr:hypothetical protein [Nitrospirillum amazonense]ASG21412.1 hypothetical protein Y958_11660 [Nitrospirillum amazonense CBAmc]TWB33090.1 hypothetical protein FBZ91_115152 [Nitrospirillum amazonense]
MSDTPDTANSITFGGQTFAFEGLTLDQLKALGPAFLRLRPESARDLAAAASTDILHVALVDGGLMTEEQFKAAKTSYSEVGAAVEALARISGMVPVGEPPAATAAT